MKMRQKLLAGAACVLGAIIVTGVLANTTPERLESQGFDTAEPASFDARSGLGRNGALTAREMDMARAAWTYFEVTYQETTGLTNSVGAYPSTTLWDTASYIGGLVAAHQLGIIDKRTFDERAMKLIGTIRKLDLFRGELPNKVYHTKTGEKVNYANKPGEVGFSALDIGRFLVWMRIVKERYPYLANAIDNALLRWNYCNVIDEDGQLNGSILGKDKETVYVQEGRLGYEEYAAKGFELWGFDTRQSLAVKPFAFTDIYGVDVPYDPRDPRVFKTKNSVLMESYLLDGLEMNWDTPQDRTGEKDVATHGWRAEFASRVYLAQQRRFEETGILTARSEHQVNGSPYFVYDTIYGNGYAWNTLDPSGVYQPDRAAVAAKAAIGMWALWDTEYSDRLFDAVADLYDPEKGFYEGIYENGDGKIPLQTANNNGIILAALLYKAQGPILQFRNTDTQYWDVAFEDMALRKERCLPKRKPAPNEGARPTIMAADFKICRPITGENGIAATDCAVANLRRRPIGSDVEPVSPDLVAEGSEQ